VRKIGWFDENGEYRRLSVCTKPPVRVPVRTLVLVDRSRTRHRTQPASGSCAHSPPAIVTHRGRRRAVIRSPRLDREIANAWREEAGRPQRRVFLWAARLQTGATAPFGGPGTPLNPRTDRSPDGTHGGQNQG